MQAEQGVNSSDRQALERLIKIAKSDTGQSRRVADFLLAWWNKGSCGGFDFTETWGVDDAIADDMICVFKMIVRERCYPDALGYKRPFTEIIQVWRPELLQDVEPS